MIGIHYSWAKSITDDERRFTIPLSVATSWLAKSIRARVSNRGETADGGQFSPLVARSRTKPTRKVRRFYKSGELWRSLHVHATQPGRVRVMFRGKRTQRGKSALTNPQLAWLLQRPERAELLAPSRREEAQFVEHLATLAPGQWLDRTAKMAGDFRQRQQDDRAARAVAKAQKLRAQLRALGVEIVGEAA